MNFTFFKESLRNMSTAGAVARSSRFLGREMVSHIRPEDKVIVELGAGDGAITEHIIEVMAPDAHLIIFEINESFIQSLKERFQHDQRITLIQDSAEHLEKVLADLGYSQADCILSAIPFVVLPESVMNSILNSSRAALRPGGRFIQFHYSLILRNTYRKLYTKVKYYFVPINMPPAFVFVCTYAAN